MHLRNRCGGKRLYVKTLEDPGNRLAICLVENLYGLFRRKRGYLVLQFGQLIGNISRK